MSISKQTDKQTSTFTYRNITQHLIEKKNIDNRKKPLNHMKDSTYYIIPFLFNSNKTSL